MKTFVRLVLVFPDIVRLSGRMVLWGVNSDSFNSAIASPLFRDDWQKIREKVFGARAMEDKTT
jgi:hypothetical protein